VNWNKWCNLLRKGNRSRARAQNISVLLSSPAASSGSIGAGVEIWGVHMRRAIIKLVSVNSISFENPESTWRISTRNSRRWKPPPMQRRKPTGPTRLPTANERWFRSELVLVGQREGRLAAYDLQVRERIRPARRAIQGGLQVRQAEIGQVDARTAREDQTGSARPVGHKSSESSAPVTRTWVMRPLFRCRGGPTLRCFQSSRFP
jgi:hypothetical protein